MVLKIICFSVLCLMSSSVQCTLGDYPGNLESNGNLKSNKQDLNIAIHLQFGEEFEFWIKWWILSICHSVNDCFWCFFPLPGLH
jgi:hypothetical protein